MVSRLPIDHHSASRHRWRVLHWLYDLRRSACQPVVFRRCGNIALVVGTLLSAVNQGDAIVGGRFDSLLALRIFANYLIPFVVSNLGAMATLPPRERPEGQPREPRRASRGDIT
jgi:hypothetical protein